MPDRFTSALLAALNNSTEIKEHDSISIEEVLRGVPNWSISAHPR